MDVYGNAYEEVRAGAKSAQQAIAEIKPQINEALRKKV